MDEDEYVRILTEIKCLDYSFEKFSHNKKDHAAILRHDIDFCVPSALKIAKIEYEQSIRATYFFMVSTNAYSIGSLASRKIIEEIRSLGHTVSLHFDPAIYDDIDKGFATEKLFLESLFDVEITSVSLHRPRGFIDNNNRKLDRVSHTYEDKFFRDMKYISDSGGRFSYGHPLDQPELQEGKNLHLLFHPIWWVNSGDTQSEKLRKWQTRYFDFINEETSLNCNTFDSVRAN